jgi:hypothetical protein
MDERTNDGNRPSRNRPSRNNENGCLGNLLEEEKEEEEEEEEEGVPKQYGIILLSRHAQDKTLTCNIFSSVSRRVFATM